MTPSARWAPATAAASYIPRMRNRRMRRGALVLAAALALAAGCGEGRSSHAVAQAFQSAPDAPDEVPRMVNREPPFRYPAALYARKVQGNVTLRLLIDSGGRVHADSTRIDESSGFAALDSAAVKGSEELRFVPAKLRGAPVAATILFPVYFRHPEAPALPGDTILNRRGSAPESK